MAIYGQAAVRGKQLILESAQLPERAWASAIVEFTKSRSRQTKGCPKGAFLGLCEAGIIGGLPVVALVSNKNGRYAQVAWKVLQHDPNLSEDEKALWARIKDRDISRSAIPLSAYRGLRGALAPPSCSCAGVKGRGLSGCRT
jgi:hypothetical protein